METAIGLRGNCDRLRVEYAGLTSSGTETLDKGILDQVDLVLEAQLEPPRSLLRVRKLALIERLVENLADQADPGSIWEGVSAAQPRRRRPLGPGRAHDRQRAICVGVKLRVL